MKSIVSDLRYFWRFLLPCILVLLISIAFSSYFGARVIQRVYLRDLQGEIDLRTNVVRRLLRDEVRRLELVASTVETDDAVSIAALYAFDNIVHDTSLLHEQLRKLTEKKEVDVALICSVDEECVLDSSKRAGATDSSNDQWVKAVKRSASRSILELDGNHYFHISGPVRIMGGQNATIHLLRVIDGQFIGEIARHLGVPLQFQGESGDNIATSLNADVERQIGCFSAVSPEELKRASLRVNGARYLAVCSKMEIRGSAFSLLAIQFYDADVIVKTIADVQYSLWALGLGLLIVGTVLISFAARASAKPVKRLAAVMNVTPGQDLTQAFREILARADEYKKEQVTLAANAAIGKIAAEVAHDIKSPLAAIQACCESIEASSFENSTIEDSVNLLRLSTKRLQGIADDLLAQHAASKERQSVFSLHHVIDELIGEYEAQKEFRSLTFKKEYGTRHLELLGDRGRFQRAIGNLIKNAVEAMNGSGELKIVTAVDSGSVHIVIQDTGPGLSAERLAEVLAGTSDSEKKGGHGIGLVVVRDAISSFGGTITIKSSPGKGATVEVKVPLSDPFDVANISNRSSNQGILILKTSGNSAILVVDDDPVIQEEWRRALTRNGKQVVVCRSHDEAQAKASQDGIGKTAVVDYRFAGEETTGADVIRMLRTRGYTYLYLCTTDYWKPSMQKIATDLDVMLCPKPLPRIQVVSERV